MADAPKRLLASSLQNGANKKGTDWLSDFLSYKPNTDAIDNAVRHFAVSAEPVLRRSGPAWWNGQRIQMAVGAHSLVLIPDSGILADGAQRKVRTGVRMPILSLVGYSGFWDEMILTLSIVLASVVLTLRWDSLSEY
ncbi:MAG: hypothetical protein ACLVJO_02370 [[Clostridium] scindens]